MQEDNFEFLKNIMSTKKQTDNLLEQQILDNEDSFDDFNSDFPIENKDKYNNGLNINNNCQINAEEKNDNKINGSKNKSVNGIKNNNIKNNKINNNNENKKIENKVNKNNSEKKIKYEVKNYSNKRIDNKRKNKKKNISSNSIDYINIQKNEDLNKGYFSDNSVNKRKKNNKILNKSIDNSNKKYFNNFNNYNNNDNKINIYQRLFDIKMKNFENFRQKQIQPILYPNRKNSIDSSHTKDIFYDAKNKRKKKMNKHISNYNMENKNKAKKDKDFIEDDNISEKSKKSRARKETSLNSSMSINSSGKFSQTYERFIEMQQKKKEKIENLKKLKEEKEKNNCCFKPKINIKNEKYQDDFYSRQKKKLEEQKKKKEQLKIKIKIQEHEINKNKALLKNKNDGIKNRRLSDVHKRINKLYEWDNARKKKLHERQKSVDELKDKEYTYKPQINKTSQKLAEIKMNKYIFEIQSRNKNLSGKDGLIERLYKDDILKRKQRQKILNQIYSPTFTPNLFKHSHKIEYNTEDSYRTKNLSKNHSKNHSKNQSKTISKKTLNYYNDDSESIIDNIKDSSKRSNDNLTLSEYYNNNAYSNSLAEQIRTKLFKKLNKTKNRSAINLMKIKENNEENSGSSSDDDYKEEKKFKGNKSKNFETVNYKKILNKKPNKIRVNLKIKEILDNYNNNKNKYLLNGETKNKNINRSIEF